MSNTLFQHRASPEQTSPPDVMRRLSFKFKTYQLSVNDLIILFTYRYCHYYFLITVFNNIVINVIQLI